MHPHWQSTGASQQKDVVPTADGVVQPNDWKPASRRPAALVGIGLVVTILFAFVHGVEYLQGQLLSEIVITIGRDGTVDPQSVTVSPGMEIAFENISNDVIIIGSSTLCDANGFCMDVAAIPQDTVRFTVPSDAPSGSHIYRNNTEFGDSIPMGEILVQGGTTPTPPIEENPVEPMPVPEEPLQEEGTPPMPISEETEPLVEEEIAPPIVEPTPAPNPPTIGNDNEEPLPILNEVEPNEELFPVDEEPSALPPLTAELPRNPYTVGSNFNPPSSPIGGPPPTELHGGAPLPPIQHHKPIRQPATGTGTWIAATLAIVGGAILLRRSRRTLLITETRSAA